MQLSKVTSSLDTLLVDAVTEDMTSWTLLAPSRLEIRLHSAISPLDVAKYFTIYTFHKHNISSHNKKILQAKVLQQ